MGRRPTPSRAAKMPSGVSSRMVAEPSMSSWAWRMPSTRVSFLADEGRHQLCLVHFAAAHGHKLMAVIGEAGVDQRFGIVDDAHKGNGIQAQVGPDQQGAGGPCH